MDPNSPAPPPTPAPIVVPAGGPLRALWHLLQPVLAVLLVLALVAGALASVAVWLLGKEDGTAWLLARVPGLEVQGVRGALLSTSFGVQRVVVRWDRGRQSVSIDELQGDGLRWAWHPAPGAWLGLQAERLQARRVDVQTGPRGPRPIVMPRSIQLPLRLQADRVEVAELQIERLPPMTQVRGQGVRLWEPGGREYHADRVGFDWDRARVDGQVSFGGNPPYTLQAQARFVSRGDGPGWSAEASARGPLARFELQVHLRGEAAAKAEAPALDLAAAITPLGDWALGTLRLRTQSLDLAALASGAPRTLLSGRAEIDTRSSGGPIAATIELDNANPGRWNEGRLPLRRLHARVRSPDADRNRLAIESFDAWFGRGNDDAGTWRGSGQWQGSRLQLVSRIEGLRPHLLDSRAAVMTLTGPLEASLDGVRAPSMAASAPVKAKPAVELRTSLDGRIEGSPQPVQLTVDGSADEDRIELRELRAEAGAARASAAANARRLPNGAWQLRSSGTLADFDPLPWWPGHEGSPWRTGPHRLTGGWALDLALPRKLDGVAPLALLQGVGGTGTLRIERSQLAGMPVTALLQIGHRPDAVGTPGSVQLELNLAGNRVAVEGRGDPMGSGHADRLQFELQAGELSALAPLARLLPELEAWTPRAGRAEASFNVEGRWPEVRSEGRASASDLQAGRAAARQATLAWRLDTAADQPLMLQLDAAELQHRSQRLEQLNASLRGTWREHRLELAAALPEGPPAALATALGLATAAGTRAVLRGEGQWSGDGAGGGRWSGRVDELRLGPWAGTAVPPPAGPGSRWLHSGGLRADLRFDARDGIAEVQAAAGQLRLADAVTLRWDEVKADLRQAAPSFALRADVEPFAIAPLLARSQPEMGWTGDLQLAARVDLKVGEQVDAEMVFERRAGDLRLAAENAGQPFGLSELRVALTAHDGLWQLGAAFAGKTLGEASGRLQLRTRPRQRWPDADNLIEGLIQARVASLGIWSSWVPPGWRLSGQLQTDATIGGRLGAPEYTGEMRAREVAVRNLLLGVDVRQGEAAIRLRGSRAEIEQFQVRGGEGSIVVSGHADLSGRPSATLQARADRFRVLGRVDRQLIASGHVALGIADDLLRVEGRVKVDQGLIDLSRSDAPALDDDVTVRHERPVAEAEAPTPAARQRRRQQIAIELDLGEQLLVRGRGIDTHLGGQLRIGSGGGKPTVHGLVNAAGGTYQAYGQKLDIERGMIVFGGEIENPTLDVLALRPNIDLQVGVAITGSLQAPRVRLYSGSDLSESDKLSWLVLGRPAEGLGRADTALLQRAAVALLAGEGEAPTDALLRNLGIDQLSLRQSDTDVRETVITLGKQLSRRWYVGYERGVNATAGTWQLIYRIAQRFTLRAQSGLENSLDLIWVWRLEKNSTEPPPAARPSVPESRP